MSRSLTHISAIVATSTGALEFATSNGFGDCWNHVGPKMSGLQREASRRMSSFNQVLNEIGVDIASQLSSAPKGRISSKKVENVVPAR
ncbi:hypothetical protein IFM89_039855 [Coptis chinensis]|uniref:Uncharacterized protein n=1 Tax=Coptis chinensis TaxID=261450 RepID=A0A835GW04_9MAGN|nr:hypothetical protein IFM89_039855 [Coptis chinensis]